MGIAWAVASGASFLNWHASRPRRVLYVDGEMAAVDLQARLKLLGSAPPTLKFMVADLGERSLPDLGYYEGQGRLHRCVGRSRAGGARQPLEPRRLQDRRSRLLERAATLPDDAAPLGRAMLLVHHANKEGGQRGTNRREDVLDLVMALKHPTDYQARDGARFEIHFEKARGLFGDAADPIEARLETDGVGVARWSWRPVRVGELERAAALLKAGLNPNQVARELGISKSQSYRLRERAVGMGLVEKPLQA